MTNTQVPHIFDDYELSSSSTPSSMHPSHSPFLFHSSAPYNHSSHHPTDQFYAQAPRPVAQSQVYSQGQAPSSAPELVTIPSQWQLQDLTQYTQHRHSLSLDTDSHSQTSQYSPAPSSALSVTSTSFSYSPFASPTENRAETSSSQCYFGGSAHPESVQPDVAAERRGSDALTYHSQHSSAHDRLTHWYGTNGGSGFGSGLEAQRAKAGSRSRTVPDVERRSIGKGSLSAGSGPAESGSSALNQIAENVGNVADCSKEDMAGVDQQASRWSTLPKQSGMDANVSCLSSICVSSLKLIFKRLELLLVRASPSVFDDHATVLVSPRTFATAASVSTHSRWPFQYHYSYSYVSRICSWSWSSFGLRHFLLQRSI